MVGWSLGERGEHGGAEKTGVGAECGCGDERAAGFAAAVLRGLLEAIDVAELAEGEVHLGCEEIPGSGDATADDVEREVKRVDETSEAAAEIAADLGVNLAGFAIAGEARSASMRAVTVECFAKRSASGPFEREATTRAERSMPVAEA